MIDAVMHFVAEIGGLYPNWGGEYSGVDLYPEVTTRVHYTEFFKEVSA